ncbi:amidohydrolase family protein [Tellurirhabdus rosea]|uniref:amidohydrolase family protein n=1 Tax=Tellurirhabdus rosea TaxID=2674997 RepID=UPI002251622A|nr:amidohydrolase family protein [Tellurirhabdus rosea]
MRKPFLTALLALALVQTGWSQVTFPRNGVYDERPGIYAFTNATIIIDPQTTLEGATLLIRDGRVEAVGKTVVIPAGAVVADLKGKRIYPALVDIDSDYGMPEAKREQRPWNAPPQLESNKKGAYGWNQAIQPETDAGLLFKVNAEKATELRKLGFGAVVTHLHDGIARGTSALVTLAEDRENAVVLKNRVSAHYSLSKGSSGQTYPNSLMGSVALLRQTYLDADWHKKSGKTKEANLSLDAFNGLQTLPSVFETSDRLGVLRADKIGDEFGVQYIIKTGTDTYARLDEVKATGAALIVPLNFPQALDVEDAWDADVVTLSEMKHWELAPTNPAAIAKAGIPFALTTANLKNKADFWANLRKAIEAGLPETKALEALTTAPARMLKIDDQVGSLKPGMVASFLITSDNLFAAENAILESWVRGKQYVYGNKAAADLRGTYNLTIGNQSNLKLAVTGKADKPEYQLTLNDTTKLSPKVSVMNDLISLQVQLDKTKPGMTRLSGYKSGNTFKGEGELPDGTPVKWSATLASAFQETAKADAKTTPNAEIGKITFPFVGMGNPEKPKTETLLIKNATVWTNEKDGILQNADVLTQNGKIVQVGKSLTAPAGARVIDGTGKHLTNGIIDEHSHIALFSVNEGSQSSTAEVRMGDAVDSEDINIYRQLAGGVTTSQLLHGSANAIGGQSAIIKLKWGETPDNLLMKGADGFIKFALGENVKQANWGEANRIRFPQTRMGVEQVYMDHFTRAKEYAKAWAAYNGLKDKSKAVAPRRDLELEALVEILTKKRFITCHSYVQSEINMLMKVADSLGFKVNTFTHILEGYKLADKMAKHGAGGSSFADWWAYKMEVKDAIPYNAALMHSQGVTVSINSDDAEMARRLNQEAAKAVEYGGVSEEDAWKMVTLNPAKLLHLDNRLGSIRAGKDADLVLWNAHPLSIYARPEKTIIDGAVYFDLEKEDAKRDALQKERARLIQKMLAAKAGGASVARPVFRRGRMWHCEDIEGVMAEGEEATEKTEK